MLKVEAVYSADYETFADVTADLPRCFEDVYNTRRFHRARPPEPSAVRRSPRLADGQNMRRENNLLHRFGEGFGLPSPLVTYASPAASAEQVCSPVNIA